MRKVFRGTSVLQFSWFYVEHKSFYSVRLTATALINLLTASIDYILKYHTVKLFSYTVHIYLRTYYICMPTYVLAQKPCTV